MTWWFVLQLIGEKTMDEQGFRTFMQEANKSERTIGRYTSCVDTFAEYLQQYKHKPLSAMTLTDVRDYAAWGEGRVKGLNQHLWALKVYGEFTANRELVLLTNELFGARSAASYKLKEFHDELYVKESGFKGIAPLPKEAAYAVETARYIDRLVEH